MGAKVAILAARRVGGGNEAAATALHIALSSHAPQRSELVILDEALRLAGGAGAYVGRALGRVSINARYFAAPFLSALRSYDVVILFHGNANFLIPYFRSAGVRTIVVCDAPFRPIGGIGEAVERMRFHALRRADLVIKTFAFADPLSDTIVPLPVKARPAAPVAFTSGPISRLAYVGRLEPEKGIGKFLQLAAALPEFKFLVYGDGACRPDVNRAVAQLGNVQAFGYSPDWLRTLPEQTGIVGCCEWEGCWTAGKEALLHGRPLIAIESSTGGPQLYRNYTDKVEIVSTLDARSIRSAVQNLNLALHDRTPVTALFDELDPGSIAHRYAHLIERLAP